MRFNPFIVAELSANHSGSLDRALETATAAAEAGADALKLQTWSPGTMAYSGIWKGQSLKDLYRDAWLPWEWHSDLFVLCKELGIECFSTPFDRDAVDFLERLGCPRYKIASFEIIDLPLIEYVASKGKPLIISTGMATWREIDEAVQAAVFSGLRHDDITILKCTSAYPAAPGDANLATMANMQTWWKECRVGLSDHTPGMGVPIRAAIMGAKMIEKHLTMKRADGGPDAAHSLEPEEFKQMVEECWRAIEALGDVEYGALRSEADSQLLRRSLWIVRDMKAGDILTTENLRTARPAYGLLPKHLPELLGRRVGNDIKAGTPMGWECLA